jgi:hypothetical protein
MSSSATLAPLSLVVYPPDFDGVDFFADEAAELTRRGGSGVASRLCCFFFEDDALDFLVLSDDDFLFDPLATFLVDPLDFFLLEDAVADEVDRSGCRDAERVTREGVEETMMNNKERTDTDV